jgi:hypothetical protein
MAVKPEATVRIGKMVVSSTAPSHSARVEVAVRGAIADTLRTASASTPRARSLQQQIQQQIAKALAAGPVK